MKKILESAEERNKVVQEIRDKRNDSSRQYANKSRVDKHFNQNDIIMLRDKTIGQEGGTLRYKFIGPYIIHKVNEDNATVILKDLRPPYNVRKSHMSHLRAIKSNFKPYGLHLKDEALELIQKNKYTPYQLRNKH